VPLRLQFSAPKKYVAYLILDKTQNKRLKASMTSPAPPTPDNSASSATTGPAGRTKGSAKRAALADGGMVRPRHFEFGPSCRV
jgi:hypothetical protein